MKKIITLTLMLILISGCSFKHDNKLETKEELKKEIINEDPIETYQDNNPIKIGLYSRKNGYYELLTEYKTKVKNSTDINTFRVLPLNDEKVTFSGKYQTFDKQLWDSIETNYKLGLNLNYSLNNGTIINHTLYDPSNTQQYTHYIQVYFYDAIKHINDKWYSHITPEEFNENTYITSFKLTAGTQADEIIYPIKISIFTYDTDDDFDEQGNYRGNSIYTIKLNKE